MGRARSGTWRKSGQAYLVMVTIPAAMFPPGKLPPPTIDPKTKKQKAHPRRLGVPVPAVTEGRTTTKDELKNLAKLFNERPDLAIVRCAKLGKLPDWIPAEMVPSEVLQLAVKANPVAANIPGSPTETVSTYAERWLDWRDKRGYTSIDNNRSALKQLLCIEVEQNITLAERPIATVSRADCKAVASYLRKCYLEKRFGKLSAYKYWGVLYSMITDSSEEGGEDDLMVRPDNPIRSVKGLDRPQPGTRGCLYASEFLKLITCEQIPLASRRVIVLAVYLQMRASELFRIRCEDLDLEREKISIRRGWDSYRKKEKLTKNGKTRIFEIPAPLLPLLRVMVAERGGTGLLLETSPYYVSHCFKAYLDAAGLHRWELRTRTETHTPLTLHGLRATGATWLACVEGNPLRLRRILGHSDQKTTDRYIDDSQLLGRNVGELFPSLPAELLGANRSGNRSDPLKNSGKPASSFLRRRNLAPSLTLADSEIQRDSTVRPPRETPLTPPPLTARNDLGTITDPAPSTLRTVDASPPSPLGPAIAATNQALNDAITRGDVEEAKRCTEALRALLGAPSEPAPASSAKRPRKRSA